jgi:hypothetical protein
MRNINRLERELEAQKRVARNISTGRCDINREVNIEIDCQTCLIGRTVCALLRAARELFGSS